MSNTLWVVLPLGVFALWVVVRRRLARPLSRHALNVQQSVLLLAYFAITSGLGIFWVANQQLPVFDLHYLFGYATVLLVVVHLAFNWRIVWAYFTRRRPQGQAAAARVDQPSRPGWPWAALGWVGAAAVGFLLGVRHGGTGLDAPWSRAGAAPPRVAADAVQAPAGRGPIEVVERYHALSSHDRVGVLTRAPSVDWGPTPEPFKSDGGRSTVALPPPAGDAPSGGSVSQVMIGEEGTAVSPSPARLDLAGLSTLLFHSVGVTSESGRFKLRAAPSSGALFPTELYVLARDVDGLRPGVFHYDPEHHRLVRRGEVPRAAPHWGVADPMAARAPAVLAVTAVFRRTGYKYRDRAYRYAVADAGHALQNVRIAGSAVGFAARPLRRFDEARAAEALGIDGVEEGVLALVALERPVAEDAGEPAQFHWPPAPEAEPRALGVTSFVHLATSLRLTALPSASPSDAAPAGATVPPGPAVRLPAPRPAPGRPLATIAARRSVRRFAAAPLPLAELSSILHYAARAPAPLSEAVRIHVVAHRVEGVQAGAYRYESSSHALVPARLGDLRAESAAAALFQEVIGDAAAVFVLSLDRAALFAADGARGYRHGFLEAGMLGERIYLEAGGRGLGACAVGAFFDLEAARLVAIDPDRAWVVHFAAVGRPAE